MADKSKKNVYRKTMGFTHKSTKTFSKNLDIAIRGSNAELKHGIQQAGSNNSVLGYKEPHKRISDANMGTYKRPPYKKDKFKGERDGLNKAFLSERGNSSKYNPFDFFVSRSARRKLVKGT